MAEPGPPRLDHRTAAGVLRHSLTSLLSAAALPSLLLAALLLLSFRSALLAGTLALSSVPDRDPAVRSLLRRLSPTPSPSAPIPSSSAALRPHHHQYNHQRRRPPFLHLTRVGTLEDDFFADPDPVRPIPLNASRLFLFATPAAASSKILVPDYYSLSSPFVFSFPDLADRDEGGDGDRDRERDRDRDRDRAVEIRILGRGFGLDRQDAAAIVYLLTVLSSTHALAILGFVLVYTMALGIVFVSVAAFHLQKPVSVVRAFYLGARLGIERLTGFVFLRWSTRDALIQFLCMWFFAEVRDQNQLFKLFVRVKLMPFTLSPLTPWPWLGDDEALSGFFFVWAMVDTMVSVALAVVPWVVIMDHNMRRRGRDVLKEGFFLVTLMPWEAVLIKFLETVFFGMLGSWLETMFAGRLFMAVLHSMAEVYFMVVWLIVYFATRSKDGELIGRRFGQRDLENCINGIR